MRCPVFALLLLAGAWPAAADPTDAEKRLLRSLAAAQRNLGRWCHNRKLGRRAYLHFAEAVALHPEGDRDARRALGFVEKQGKWVREKTPARKDEPPPRLAAQYKQQYAKKLAALQARSLDGYRKLAAEAKQAEAAARLRTYHNRILAFAADDAQARAALGWGRRGRYWVEQALSARLDAAPAGKVVAQRTRYEQTLGLSLNKRRSEHVYLATFEPDALCAKLIQSGETAYAVYHEWLAPATPLRAGRPVTLFFFAGQATYQAAIDKLSNASAARKALGKRSASTPLRGTPIIANWLRRREETYQRDRVIYLTTGQLVYSHCGGSKKTLPWLAEGLAWEMTLRLLGTKFHHSVSLASGSADRLAGKKRWSDHARWRGWLRELALLDEAPRAASVLSAASVNDIDNERAAFAWSMARYLLQQRRKELGAYCRALAEGKGAAGAVRAAFGTGFDGLEAAWRTYVLQNF